MATPWYENVDKDDELEILELEAEALEMENQAPSQEPYDVPFAPLLPGPIQGDENGITALPHFEGTKEERDKLKREQEDVVYDHYAPYVGITKAGAQTIGGIGGAGLGGLLGLPSGPGAFATGTLGSAGASWAMGKAVDKAAEWAGLKREEDLTEDMASEIGTDVAIDTAIAAVPYIHAWMKPFIKGPVDKVDDVVRGALKFMERAFPDTITKNVDSIKALPSKLDTNTRQLVEVARKKATKLARSIGEQLGIASGKSVKDRAFAKQFDDAIETLLDAGVFDGVNDLDGLLFKLDDPASGLIQEMAVFRDGLIDNLDKVSKQLQIPWDDAFTQGPIAELRKRSDLLKATPATRGMSKAIDETLENMYQAVNSSGNYDAITAFDLNNHIKNLNEYRRIILKEFSNANVVSALNNDPLAMAAAQESLTAIKKISDGFRDQLYSLAEKAANKGLISFDPKLLKLYNERYGAMKDLSAITQSRLYDIRTGQAMRPGASVIQNPGSTNLIPPNAFSKRGAMDTAVGAIERNIDHFRDTPTASLVNMNQMQDASQNTMANIQDLIRMNQNPITDEAIQSSIGAGSRMGQGFENVMNMPGGPQVDMIKGVDMAQGLLNADQAMSQVEPDTQALFDLIDFVSKPEPPSELPRDSKKFFALTDFEETVEAMQIDPELKEHVLQAATSGEAEQELVMGAVIREYPEAFKKAPVKGMTSYLNGKVLDPNERGVYLKSLKKRQREGEVSLLHLTKQRQAFHNPDDLRLLPIEEKKGNRVKGKRNEFKQGQGRRFYSY